MKVHFRDEGNSELDPFETSNISILPDFWLDHQIRHRSRWSFAFTHASTSSKCILFAIQYLFQCNPFVDSGWPWRAEWLVSEMIDWLKVRDPVLIKEISCNLTIGIWEEPNSGPSLAAGSGDCLAGRCKQKN
jgi:hypothetical protein